MGIALGTLRRWEQGLHEPDIESIIRLSSLYGVTTDTLLGSQFADEIEGFIRSAPMGNSVDVPLYGSIAAGVAIEMMPVEDMFPIPSAVHGKHPHGYLLRVEGESMNLKIPNGAYAYVDPYELEIFDMQPYALCINDSNATIKLVRELNNGIELIPASTDPTFKPRILDYEANDTDRISVIGRVVWHTIPFDWKY